MREIARTPGVDLTIDTAAGSVQTITQALDVTRKRGRLVIPAATRRSLANVDFYKVTLKRLNVKGPRRHSCAAVEKVVELIASDRHPPSLCSHAALDDVLGGVAVDCTR